MPIAPWENPDLPAPFATLEREVEGRTRRFALWRWDGRVVWRDVEHPHLWWATLEGAETLGDWERALEMQAFGRAYSERHRVSGKGEKLGLGAGTSFKAPYDFAVEFTVIGDGRTGGIAREKSGGAWWVFAYSQNAGLKRRAARRPDSVRGSLLWTGLQLPTTRGEVLAGFAPQILEQIPPGLADVLRAGANAPVLLILRDLELWRLCHLKDSSAEERRISTFDFVERNQKILGRLREFFGLLPDTRLHSGHSHPREPVKELISFCIVTVENIEWRARRFDPFPTHAPSARQSLEIQSELAPRLRESLRPIFTVAEIEEILGAPARL